MDAALVILDGWGLGAGAPGWALAGRDRPTGGRDAVADAATPNFDRLARVGAYGTLDASGRAVGLPAGQMGNSEVGHLTIGAGAVLERAFTRIEDAIDAGELADRPAIDGLFEHLGATGGRLHLVGLVSDGGVHAHQRHLHALVRAAADRGVEAVTHAVTDGRDTPPRAGPGYLRELRAVAEAAGTGAVATVSGRYYAMDRDRNWERTRRAYDAVVNREAEYVAESGVAAVERAHDRGEGDEFVVPTLIEGGPPLADGDALFAVNFRADRTRQFVRMVADHRPEWPFDTDPPDVRVATMTEYDADFPFPVAFGPNEPAATLGSALSAAGRTQLRLAESEKYAHVTYFLNGGREVEFDGEYRHIVDSPDVPTYDRRPEMSAPAVTDTALRVLDREAPDAVVCNYANPDMVGHTGDYDAAVAACEAVDRELGRLVGACRAAGATVLVTADHGNAEDVGTAADPHTAHTANPVPLIALGPGGPPVAVAGRGEDGSEATGNSGPTEDTGPVGDAGPTGDPGPAGDGGDGSVGGGPPASPSAARAPGPAAGGRRVRTGGGLSDLAPTLLSAAGVAVPASMTGRQLLVPADGDEEA